MKLTENFYHHQTRRTLVRLDDDVRNLTVQRIPYDHQIHERLARIGFLQQRTITIARGAVELLLDRRAEINHPTTSAQCVAIILPQHRTATGRQHDAPHPTQVYDGSVFPFAKPLLTLDIEYQRNAGAGTLLDLLVGIPKGKTKLLGEQAPDGAFTGTHRAHENDVFHQVNDSLQWPGDSGF